MPFHIFMYILKACVKVSGRETTKLPKGQRDGENNVRGIKSKACQKLWSLCLTINIFFIYNSLSNKVIKQLLLALEMQMGHP